MTHPNPPEVVMQGEALLPVIQADREAAAYVAKLLTGAAVEHILEGFEDDTGTVQAFARHRLRHTPDREAIARVLRGYMRDGLEPEPFGGSLDTADLAADAIIAMFEGGGAHG